MASYKSNSSISVKIMTIGGVVILVLLVFIVLFINTDFGLIAGIISGGILIAILIYFYSQSLKLVTVKNNKLILEKNIGRIEIDLSEISSIKTVASSAIPMTVGSKGFFGYIGTTMDGFVSFVKNRSQMVQLITLDRKYLFSCANSKDLVNNITPLIVRNVSQNNS